MWFRVPYSIISLLLKEKLRERVSECRGPPPRHGTLGGEGRGCLPLGIGWCRHLVPLSPIPWKLLSPNPWETEAFSACFVGVVNLFWYFQQIS